jgi:hypothetical protein
MSKTSSKIDNFKEVMNKIQIPYLLYSYLDLSSLVFEGANDAALKLLGYENTEEFTGVKPESVFGWSETCDVCAIRGKLNVTDNSWIKLEAIKKDETKIPLGVNAVDFLESSRNYIVIILRDRTEAVKEEGDLNAALAESTNYRNMADSARMDAERARDEALLAKTNVEQSLASQKKLNSQIEFLKFSLKGIMGLIVLLCAMVLVGWHLAKFDKDSLAMFERILLVLIGMLSTSASGIFDKKASDSSNPAK